MGFEPYRSPSTGRPVRAVLFDTFGTVVDWRTGVAREVAAFAAAHGAALDAHAFAGHWRALYQPAMDAIRSGQRTFTKLDTLHRENLDRALRQYGIDPDRLPGESLEELNKSWHRLPPWPDSVEGLAGIRRHYIVGPLSNGNTSLLLDMARNAGLPWDVIIGSDITRAYKPLPQAYLRTVEFLDLNPGEVMLAAAHNNDLQAARGSGLATAFIARPTEYGPGQTADLAPEGDWDLVASNITGLADRLGA
ncbi:2-haloalkanoic acid dehalogenase, type II [Pseudarthrobacter phenanthrenivorans Sphe3]|uniref:2-haloalkanoic acid dehalogenase, type II n=1 Tax=Pseudarthrobacter phenanthrenivorans (strain DSM 18606 / JCM 16027 / LMG 23796 / Sphe3) TaxID=930171 RepID=F0M3L0_PSEPM|nr:haloacid dehalogenase type II [Pseudarthrobacter phenanthrenivorans]ADX72229.1 2-haloalkanoic acid dehalogenase, type II [Pseudarthrobacter phenanthrenivorans Sphe3]